MKEPCDRGFTKPPAVGTLEAEILGKEVRVVEHIDHNEWQRCVEGWRSLMRQIKEGRYELPIACIVFNGTNMPLLIRGVEVVGDVMIEVIEEGKEHSPPLRITRTKPVTFKVGKDRNGMGKTIFLTTLE
ncbi:MAG: hypothetical protein V1885_00210 [Candidatus Brennerbacteria bacterium]